MSRYSFTMPSHPGRKGWFRVGELEVTTTAIMVALGVLSMFLYAIDLTTFERFVFFGDAVRDGQIYRLATWPLMHVPSLWVILTFVFFWFVGHRIEDEIGRVRFLTMMVLSTIVSAALVTVIPVASDTSFGSGLSILGFGLLVVIAIQSPQQPWFFGIPLWILVSVIAAIQALQIIAIRAWGYLLLEILVIVTITIGAASYGLIDKLPFIPRAGQPRARRTRSPRGRKGTVTQGPWSSPSGSTPAGPSRLEQAELDVLLDKIGQSGIDSLSKEERRRLDELSRRMRDS